MGDRMLRGGMRTAVPLLIALAACARVTSQAPLPGAGPGVNAAGQEIAGQLLAADRAFAAATAARGLDGWMSFIAPDAVRLGRMANPVRGTSAIRASDAAIFADPAVRLTWDPTDAGAFDASHGWTVGRSQVHRRRADGTDEIASTGRYVTIWRRAADGRWLVVLDTGAQDPAPAR